MFNRFAVSLALCMVCGNVAQAQPTSTRPRPVATPSSSKAPLYVSGACIDGKSDSIAVLTSALQSFMQADRTEMSFVEDVREREVLGSLRRIVGELRSCFSPPAVPTKGGAASMNDRRLVSPEERELVLAVIPILVKLIDMAEKR